MTTLPKFVSGMSGLPKSYDLTGYVGPLSIRGLSNVIIRGGAFTTIYMLQCSNVTLQNFTQQAPHAADQNAQAVRLLTCTNIIIEDATITGSRATNGVDKTSKVLDATHNVIGLPSGKGINVDRSSANVTLRRLDISCFHKGICLAGDGHKVLSNKIHGLRTTPISGSGGDNWVIDGNRTWDSEPWNFSGEGDHGDRIHIWTESAAKGGKTVKNLVITNNSLLQGTGGGMLGIYLDDNHNGFGFESPNISGNLIVDGQGQGMRLECVVGTPAKPAVVSNNQLRWSGTGTAKTNTPRIDFKNGCRHIRADNNRFELPGDVTVEKLMTAADKQTIIITGTVRVPHVVAGGGAGGGFTPPKS